MGYRDERETRRAHVRRLEEELAELEAEEALVLSLPEAEGAGRLFGGPRKLERRFVVQGAFDLEALANEVYAIDGRVDADGDAVVWRGEPEPRPRRVEIRATPIGEGRTAVQITDEGSYRAYLALGGFAYLLMQAPRLGAIGLVATILGVLAVMYFLRREVLKVTRRRARQGLALEEAAEREGATRVRVATQEDGAVDDPTAEDEGAAEDADEDDDDWERDSVTPVRASR